LLIEDAIGEGVSAGSDLGGDRDQLAVLDVGVLDLEGASQDGLQLTGEKDADLVVTNFGSHW